MIVIQKRSFSLEELREIFKSSLSKQDVAIKLGFTYSNGKVYKKIEKLSIEYNLSTDHFDPFLSQRLNTKFPKIEKECPICGNLFETKHGHRDEKITCSISCSNTYFAPSKHTELSNLKRSLKLLKNSKNETVNIIKVRKKRKKNFKLKAVVLYIKSCEFCDYDFETYNKNKRFCNISCQIKHNWEDPNYRINIINKANERVTNGTHNGWSSRSKLKPSYAEQYVINLLDELKITNITREYKINKWFIDFADIDRKLALEIDGKQHELPERKASDQVKDQYLKDNGWTILRIKWKKITAEFREELIKVLQNFTRII